MNPLTTPPSSTVGWSAAAGAGTIILTWGVKQFGGVDIPTDVAQAITLLTTVLLTHVMVTRETLAP